MQKKIIATMKICLCILMVIQLILSPYGQTTSLAAVSVSAQSAILIEADTGRVLYEKNAHEQRSMASTTKIMTALLAIEEMEKRNNPEITITHEMVAVEGSSMGLRADDVLRLDGIIKGMLLASGNDAANAAAIFISGDANSFKDEMNRKAKEIGMENSNFVTPSGLDDDEHYSTAYDMALLGAYAIKHPTFREICSTKNLTVSFIQPEKKVWYKNHNRLLSSYDGCIGVKTGFTKKSGRCLVSAAERDGVALVAVTLNAPSDWNDHARMFDYGFSLTERMQVGTEKQTYSIPVVGGKEAEITATAGDGVPVTLFANEADKVEQRIKLPAFVYAPLSSGETLGEIEYLIEGKKLVSIPIIADRQIDQTDKLSVWQKLWRRITNQ